MQPSSPAQGATRAFVRALRTSLTAAIAAALLEVGWAALRGESRHDVPDVLSALLAAIGLWGMFGLSLGLGLGAVAAGLGAALPAPGSMRAFLSRIRNEEGLDHAIAAGLLALGGGLLVEIVLVRGYLLTVGLGMASRKNTATSTGLVAAIGLVLLAALAPALYFLCRRVAGLVPRPRAFVLVALSLLAVVAGAVLVLSTLDWRIMDFGPYRGLGLYVLLAIAVALVPLERRAMIPALLALTLLGLWWGMHRFVEPRAIHLVAEETGLSRRLLAVARALTDHDHDGYSARFGGGDCDDHDPSINPGAVDVPGDGIDQDCDGVDAQAHVRKIATTPAPAARTWAKDLNVLVITIDTLRADRLTSAKMPRAFAFAQGAVRFDTAYAQAPNTPRSFPSFLTSRVPSKVRWASHRRNFPPLVPSSEGGDPTFFEELARAGLAPHGVFSHFYMVPENGITTGFRSWDNAGALTLHDSNTDISSPRITERVVRKLKELAAKHERFALWTHLFDPHSKYMDHPEFPTKGSGFAAIEQKYDGEVAFTDKHIGLILDALDQAGLADKTIVVLMADHGEAFGEHKFAGERMFFHGETIYDELLRVPLALRVPGVAPRAVPDPIMLIDLGPTLLDLVDAKAPASMQGRSLVGAMLGQPLEPEPVFAELLPVPSWQHKWRAVRQDGWLLLDKQSEGSVELYDVAQDPTQQHDLAEANPDRVKSLRAAFARGL